MTEQREADAVATAGQLLPALSASGTFTYNQYEAVLAAQQTGQDPIVIQPHDGVTASVQLSAPLIDLAGWRRTLATRAQANAARLSAEAASVEVERQVAQAYFQIIAAEALVRSFEGSLSVARENEAAAMAKRQEGVATDLDVSRASVDVAGLERSTAEQKLSIALARRTLRTLSGLEPAAGAPDLVDDLHDEGPLESWERRAGQVPSVRAADENEQASRGQAQATRLGLLPTVTATATEQATNAPGFIGHSAYFTAAVTASWRLDVPTLARVRGQEAAQAAAGVQREASLDRARDAIHEAWQRIASGIAASRAARGQATSARLAAECARDRYAGGAGTELEVSQALRDQSSMEAAQIQADANVALARVLLRLAAGER